MGRCYILGRCRISLSLEFLSLSLELFVLQVSNATQLGICVMPIEIKQNVSAQSRSGTWVDFSPKGT